MNEQELARIYSPLGLDLRAETPAETTVSVFAQWIARRNGGSGLALDQIEGTIHGCGHRPRATTQSRAIGPAHYWSAAMHLTGDIGLASIARSENTVRIECGDVASVTDMDTPADMEKLLHDRLLREKQRWS